MEPLNIVIVLGGEALCCVVVELSLAQAMVGWESLGVVSRRDYCLSAGLQRAAELGIQKVMLEIDAMLVV